MSTGFAPSARIGRRTLLQGAAAGTVALGGLSLFGCGGRPSATNNKTVVTLETHGALGTAAKQILGQSLAPFLAQNKDLAIQFVPWQGPAGGDAAALIGGTGPDLVYDDYAPTYWEQNLLMRLDDYLKTDQVSTSIWSKGVMDQLTLPSGLFMLPVYFQPFVYMLRLDLFDAAGVAYPDTNWTYTDFAKLASQLTTLGSNGKYQYGATMYWYHYGIDNATYMLKAFNGSITDAAGTTCTLNSANSIAAGKWLYEGLFWPKYATVRDEETSWGGFEESAMALMWGQGLVDLAESSIGQDGKWQFFPFPIFPAGRTTMADQYFYGINAQTRHPDAAWRVLKEVTAGTAWQTAYIKIGMQGPSLNSLWDQFEFVAESVVPFFKNKGLHWFTDAAQNGYAFPEQYYGVADRQARATQNGILVNLWNKAASTSVTATFTEAATQVNKVLQAALSSGISRVQAAESGQAQAGGLKQPYPNPPLSGAGLAYAPAPSGAITGSGGSWTLIGQGLGAGTPLADTDACIFAATAETQYTGTWTCQLTTMANKTEQPGLLPLAQAGIMVRSDLSDNAMMIQVCADMFGGIMLSVRGRIGANPVITKATDTAIKQLTKPTGFIQPTKLFSQASSPANYLQVPVWIRLTRNGQIWQAYTSLDGKTFTQVDTDISVPMGGVWLGLFASAGTTAGTMEADFSGVTFTPDQMAQIGPPQVSTTSSSASSSSASG